jgi:hypothetical protein
VAIVANHGTNAQKGTTNVPGVDRDAIRLDYVTSSVTLEACAKKYGVKGPTLRKWAREDHWDAERREYRERFHEQATQSKIDNAAARLAQWNEETLLHAGLLREAARRQFQYQTEDGWRFREDASSKQITAAAAAHVAADKLARLALGASTENVNQNNKLLPATVDDFF